MVRAIASDAEVLRHRDVASLSAAEKQPGGDVRDAAAAPPPRHVPPGTSAGTAAPSTRPEPCAPACAGWANRPRSSGVAGAQAAAGGLLVDVSGSMSAYADALLRLAHRFGGGRPGGVSRCSPSAPG